MSRVRSLRLAWAGMLAVYLLAGPAGARAQYIDADRVRQNTEMFQQKDYDVDKALRNMEKERAKAYGRHDEDEPAPKVKVNVEEVMSWVVVVALAGVGGFLGVKAVGGYLNQSSAAAKATAREQALNDPWVQARLASAKPAGTGGTATLPPGQ